MKVTRGRVVDGKIVVDGIPLPEGREVAVCFEEDDSPELSPADRSGLLAAMSQLEAEEGITKDELFSRLAARNR